MTKKTGIGKIGHSGFLQPAFDLLIYRKIYDNYYTR